jgi:hypothetical protein
MNKLSIATAWEESTAIVRRDFGRLFLIAFGLVSLPGVIFQSMAPQAVPGQQPEPGAWALFIIPVLILSTLGTVTISLLALSSQRQPGDAFARALRRFLPVLGAALLLGVLAALAAIPFLVLVAFVASQPQTAAFSTLVVFFVIFVFLWVRLMLMTAVGAAEEGGAIAILKRSWALTRGHFWRLFGFVMLFIIVFVVLTMAVTFVGGSLIVLVAGNPQEPGLARTLLGLLGGVVNAVVVLYFTVVLARVYVQLSGGAEAAELSTKGI